MRVLVCGGRDFGNLPLNTKTQAILDGCLVNKNHPDYLEKKKEHDFIIRVLEDYSRKWCPGYPSEALQLPEGIVIIAGKAKGVDTVAVNWAVVKWLQFEEYPADWTKYGKRAGYLRNLQMLEEGNPDLVVAFPGGKGTAMMIKLAKETGVPVEEVIYP